MTIPYNPVINELEIAEAISGESHLVGIVGTATYVPSTIRLVQVPQGPFPAVTIPGFSEVLSYSGTNQFIVDYTTGVVVFSSDVANGTSVAASYNGLGSEFAAEDVNELQAPLSAIATQSIIYNWPSAPTVTYVLNPTTLTSSHIFVGNASNVATDTVLSGDATISNVGVLTISNGVVTGTKIASSTITQSNIVAGTITNTSINASAAIAYSKLALTGDILATDIASGQVVKSVNSLMDAITLAAGSGITITPSGNTLTFASTGSGVSSITGTADEIIASSATGAVTLSTPQAIATTSTPTFAGETLTGPLIEIDGFDNTVQGWSGGDWYLGLGPTLPPTTNFFHYESSNLLRVAEDINFLFLAPTSTTIAGTGLTIPGGAALILGSNSSTLTFFDSGSNTININAPASVTPYSLVLPNAQGAANSTIINDGSGNLSFTASPTFGGISITGSAAIGGAADPSAVLTLVSTTQGFLPPVMTSTQRTAISSPATGLIVYDSTSNQWMGWNGSSWAILG